MKLLNIKFLLVILTALTGCATPQLWLVSQGKNGGVVGYRGYENNEEGKKLWRADFKKVVQCPDAVVPQAWESKSRTTQETMIVPLQNRSTTTTKDSYTVNNRYGMNLGKVNGNSTSQTTSTSYEAIPYTDTVSWVEQKYVCDWGKIKREKYSKLSTDEKLKLNHDECNKGSMEDCYLFGLISYREKKDEIAPKLMAEKICVNGDPIFGPASCYFQAMDAASNDQIKKKTDYFKKGCDIIKSSDEKPFSDGYLNCVYYGAITKNETDLNIGLPFLLSRCSEDKKECYDLACAYSLFGDKSKSLEYLKISLDAGYDKWSHIESDSDLDNVRKFKEFKELIKQYQSRVPAGTP